MSNQEQTKRNSIFTEYQLSDMFELPNPSVRGYFSRVQQGQPEVYTTPWVKGESTEEKLKNFSEIVQEWSTHLESLKDKWPTLYEYEKDQEAKIGPMSVMKPFGQRIEDIEAYYEGILLPASPIDPKAINAVLDEFSSAVGVTRRSTNRTWEKMKKSTSSGTPYYKKKRTLKYPSECLPRDGYTKPGKGIVSYKLRGDKRWPCTAILGWRGQEGGPTPDDTKQRVVWMFPTAVNLEELTVYQPLIEALQETKLCAPWVSIELVDERITQLFDTKHPDDLVVCTDFTKFDQHFNPVCQDAALAILRGLFRGDPTFERWASGIYPIKYNIPLLCTDHVRATGSHGMGSGSGGTNADETLLHRALQWEAALKSGKQLNTNSMCLGDDGILSYPGITIEQVTEAYTSHGLEMNESKQSASAQDCTFLRRWHHKDYRNRDNICVGVYPTMRALGRLCMQERYYDPEDWGPRMVALRELSILENCRWHPLIKEFVQFCIERDKFRLGIDIPRFLDDIDRIASEATDQMPDFLGYTKSMTKNAEKNVSGWWIVKYLKWYKKHKA